MSVKNKMTHVFSILLLLLLLLLLLFLLLLFLEDLTLIFSRMLENLNAGSLGEENKVRCFK